jgi:hypothetical protein
VADQLCTPSDLAAFLKQDLDASTATLLVECATATIQGVVGHRLVRATDTANIPSPDGPWLQLPQWPVVSVSSVAIDGTTVTDYSMISTRLWRVLGWQTSSTTPSVANVTYTHGYASTDQALQLARSVCLSLAAAAYTNPEGATQVKIDDYAAAYTEIARQLEAAPRLKDLLRGQYGGAIAAVRI